MKAIVIENYGGPEQLVAKDVPTPTASDGEVLIKVKAFGINRAETYFRKGAWGDVARITGIEAVGQVEDDPSGTFERGETVATIMGGLGRTRNGSYAEYVTALATNVFRFSSQLPWTDLAAIPESYATAWVCLFGNLRLTSGETLLVRGATSALGQAAVNIAKAAGIDVIAATRSASKADLLCTIGASKVLIEDGDLSPKVRESRPEGIDAVYDLVGSSTIADSVKMVRRGGRVCMAGFLGGGDPIVLDPLKGDLSIGVDISFFAGFGFGTAAFPLSEIPMQDIVDRVAQGVYKAKPARVFSFDQLPEAHRLMESNTANGKIVVALPG